MDAGDPNSALPVSVAGRHTTGGSLLLQLLHQLLVSVSVLFGLHGS